LQKVDKNIQLFIVSACFFFFLSKIALGLMKLAFFKVIYPYVLCWFLE